MRRCGRAYCLLLACLVVTGLTAGGALAAPGGNGNKGKRHAGRGLALAKGHAKHASAAPQSPQAPAKPAAPSGKNEDEARGATVSKRVAPKAPAGVDRRASHLTICHRTGSGRYIVISPSVTGATNGHLKHHDDFVYTGSCTQSAQTPPDDPPAEPPATGEHPPRDPSGATGSAAPSASPSGDLPFTGSQALYLFLAGSVLIASGLALLRRKPTL
jgi:hypothetical protein